MPNVPTTLGLTKDGLLFLGEILDKLFRRVNEFEWYNFSTNMFFGLAKLPRSEHYGTRFYYIVGICHNDRDNEYQFIISHDKYFVSNHQFLMNISQDMHEFELVKKLYEHLASLGVKKVFHNLPHPVYQEWQGSARGPNSFLTSIPDIKSSAVR